MSTLSASQLGLIQFQKGNNDLAESLLRTAILTGSNDPIAFSTLGIIYKQKNDFSSSLKYYELAIDIEPDNSSHHYNLGLLYQSMSNNGMAIKSFLSAYQLSPNDIDIIIQLCKHYTLSKDYDSPKQILSDALNVYPSNPSLLHTLSSVLIENSEFSEALVVLNKYATLVETLTPDILFNLLIIQVHFAQYSQAEITSAQIIELDPDYKPVRNFLMILALLNKRFSQGWKYHEGRSVRCPEWSLHKPSYVPSRYQSVLVTAEQGIGDEILYASVISDLLMDTNIVYLQADSRLHSLYRRSFPSTVKLLSFDDKLDDSLYQSTIRLGSLPSLYRNDLDSFSHSSSSYLISDKSISSRIRSEIKSAFPRSLIVGLSWKSSPNRRINKANSIELFRLLKYFQGLNIVFVNLQYGSVVEEIETAAQQYSIPFLSDNTIDIFNEIDHLASLMSACDHVITTPNLNVSLAGSLGVKTHFLVPKGGDRWRWGINDVNSYWFDSVSIYRQQVVGDWTQPLIDLRQAFTRLAP